MRKDERGVALPEVAIALGVMLTAIFGVVEISRLMWTVNALTDGTRQGVRYAVVNAQDKQAVRNIVASAVNPLNPDLNPSVDGCSGNPPNSICVEYSTVPPFDLGEGQVTVTIVNYQFNFAIPLVGGSVTLPPFKTTLTAESAGVAPPTSGTPAPTPPPGATPTPTPTPTPEPTPTPAPTPEPTPTPDPTPEPTPVPTPTPSPSPLAPCAKNQVVGSPATCNCDAGRTIQANGQCK